MRAIVLLSCFVAASGTGAWLGLAVAFISGLTSVEPPRFPSGNLAASAFALGVLAVLCVIARRAGGIGIGDPARARAEGRSARNSLLLSATFSAFAIVLAVFVFGRVPSPSLIPAVLVALLLALAAVRCDPLLRLLAVCAAVLCVLAGLAVAVAQSF